jgi:hypothetical protein
MKPAPPVPAQGKRPIGGCRFHNAAGLEEGQGPLENPVAFSGGDEHVFV